MAPHNKIEIDICRLLQQCEKIASSSHSEEKPIDWRLSKYLHFLDRQIESLERNEKNKNDLLREYKRKVLFLKDIVKADELKNPLERVMLCNHLLPSAVISSSSVEGSGNSTRDLHLQVKGKHQKDIRKELFGENFTGDGIHRRKNISDTGKDNFDEIIKAHHDMQEKVANEMIKMAQSMKHTSLIANKIIKADNLELEKTSKMAEQNSKKLKAESDRLEELTNKTCSWTIWIMLIIVCVVFINMIIFIKFFPKKRR